MSNHPTQLFALLFNDGKLEQLESALIQTRERMVKAGEENLWDFWKCLSLASRGELDEADRLAQSLPAELAVQAQRATTIQRAQRQGDWTKAVAFFEKLWKDTGAPSELLNLCEAQLNAGNPSFVLAHADALISNLGTPRAVQLAITGAVRIKEWRRCLQLLDANVGIFPNNQLPADLKRLRITCEQHLGMLIEAARHAEELVDEDSAAENFALLFHVRVTSGQLKEAALPAKHLVHNPNTPVETLMQVGWAMRLEDRALAEVALRKAVERGVSGPQEVSMATLLAHELPTQDLLSVLIPKMNEEAKKPNPFLWMADISEIVTLLNTGKEQAMQALNFFRAGKLPVHVLRHALRWPLASWPILAISANSDSEAVADHLPIFFRHGGRPSTPQPRTIKRLFLDITAFVNAHELGLLSLVEKVYGPLFIPPALRASLVLQLDDASSSQPDVVEARSVIIKLLNEKQIQMWAPPAVGREEQFLREGINRDWWMALNEMKERNGKLVDFWPKIQQSGSSFEPPSEITPLLTTLAATLLSLRRMGKITEGQLKAAKAQFESLSIGVVSTEPAEGQVLFLEGHVAETFAQANLLQIMAKTFALVMSDSDVARIRHEDSLSRWRAKVAGRINAMLQTLRTSNSFADLILDSAKEPVTKNETNDASLLCLEQLLQFDAREGDFVWLDDRYLNAYDQSGHVPTITTLGIIEELRRGGNLSLDSYFEFRHRLRAADFRYLPLSEEELLFHLKQATTSNSEIVETPELRELRRYFARAILDRETLQLPPLDFATPKPGGETEFLVSIVRSIAGALVAIFAEPQIEEAIQHARANWLLQALWCLPEHFARILSRAVDLDKEKEAQGAGDLMLLGKLLDQKSFGSVAGLERYVAWLEGSLFVDKSRQVTAAEQVKASLKRQVAIKPKGAMQRRAFTEVLRNWYFVLPPSIRKRIQLPSKLRQEFNSARRQAITIGDIQFDAAQFWKAAEEAYRRQDIKLTPVGGSQPFGLTIDSTQRPTTLLLQQEKQEVPWGIADDIVGLVDPNSARRKAILRRHPEWFDSVGHQLEKQILHIMSISPGSKRLSTVDEARKKSVWNHYVSLESICRGERGPTVEQLKPPQPSFLATFLRWHEVNNGRGLVVSWEAIGEQLIKDLGFDETFRRLALLPLNLPMSILDGFDAQSLPNRRKFLGTLESTFSPLLLTHQLRLKLRSSSGPSEIWALVETLLGESMHTEAQALLQVVRWSWSCFGAYVPERTMTETSRLAFAWVHGGTLFEILRSKSTAKDVIHFFSQFDGASASEFFVAGRGVNDCSFPRNVTARTLILTAVASALSAENTIVANIPDRIRSAVEEICIERQNDLSWPKVDWLYDQEVFANSLGSFFGDKREILFSSLLGEKAIFLSGIEMRKQLDALIKSLEENAGQDSSWALLALVLRGQPCSPSLRTRLRALMEQVDFMTCPSNEQLRYGVVLALAVQAWPLGERELTKRWQDIIVGFAKWLGLQSGDDAQKLKRKQMVLHCIQALTRNIPGIASVEIFVATALAAWREWDEFGLALGPLVPLMLTLPEEQLAVSWPLILNVRRNGIFVAPQKNGRNPRAD